MAARRDQSLAGLPYRGRFGARRTRALDGLALPPAPMPSHDGLRPVKAWRYVGAYGPEIMLCLGQVRVGALSQSFWAIWDRALDRLEERTVLGRGQVWMRTGAVGVRSEHVEIELALEEGPGVETISRTGHSYAWTRKQGGVPTWGSVSIGGARRAVRARAVIDDSAGYHARHTSWRWCAGVGLGTDARELAWNLVEGLHDAPLGSERTVWLEGEPHEVGPVSFDPGLRGVGGLRFDPEAERARRDNLLIVRSSYRQPFGTFSGELPGGVKLAEGYGVMESHDAWW